MTAPDAAALERAVRAEDAALVRALLQDATEGERRVLAKALRPLLEGPEWELPKPVVFDSLAGGMAFIFGKMAETMAGVEEEPTAAEQEHSDWWQLRQTPAFAAFAVGVAGGRQAADGALNDCHGRHWHVDDAEYEALAGVLADRKPPWLADLVERRLTARVALGLNAWPLARWLVRLAAIERPAVPEYGAGMVRALAQDPPLSPPLEPGQSRFVRPEYDGPKRELAGTGGDRLARALAGDPGLLEHEVWRLFTDPGAGQEMESGLQVTSWDQLVVGDQWTDALVALAASGQLDRGRLIDECLDAFLRDFPPNHVGWYVRLHDRLAPSPDEAAARAPRYLALLAANSKPGVALGQRACAALLEAGRLEPAAFLAASGATLAFPQKSVATAQLKLIGKLAAGNSKGGKSAGSGPSVRELALATAAQAFAHQREDVQSAALKLIGKHGLPADGTLRAQVIELAAALSPVLRPDAEALGLIPSPRCSSPWPPAGPAAPPGPGSLSAVMPVTDPDELVQLLARLMEDATDALAVERALAGAVRLAPLPPAERARLARPLVKRARKQAMSDFPGPFSGYAIRADMSWLTLTWATGELPPASCAEHSGWHPPGHDTPWQSRRPTILSGILSARIGEACMLIAFGESAVGREVPLLAEPELSDGTITPAELTAREARWAAAGLKPHRYDLEVARLRAGPDTDEVLAFEPFFTRQTVGYREMAWGGQDRFAEGSTGVHARLVRSPKPAWAPSWWPLLTSLAHASDGRQHALHNTGVRLDELIAAWPLLCPHQPELLAAHLLSPLSDGLRAGRNAAATALRGLGPNGATGNAASFGKMGHLALVAGLSGHAAEVRVAAAEAWTRIALGGRLDPALAAEAISLGVGSGVLTLSRIADGLGYAAAEPAAAAGVARACVSAAAALLTARPAGLHLLLEVAARASAAAGVPELPGSITDLAASTNGSKLAEAARRLTRARDVALRA